MVVVDVRTVVVVVNVQYSVLLLLLLYGQTKYCHNAIHRFVFPFDSTATISGAVPIARHGCM